MKDTIGHGLPLMRAAGRRLTKREVPGLVDLPGVFLAALARLLCRPGRRFSFLRQRLSARRAASATPI